jgi:FkbM family methyltransferase
MKFFLVNLIFKLPYGYYFLIKKISFIFRTFRDYPFSLKSFTYFTVRADLSNSAFAPLLKFNCYTHQLSEDLIAISFLKKGDQVIDIGANIGFNSAIYSDLVGETGKVFSFEPSVINFKFIHELSIKYKQIIPLQLAAGDINAMLNFSDEHYSDRSHINENKISKRNYLVKCVRLDDWQHTIKNFHPKFLKIDTEGYDLKVLTGSSNVIKTFQPIICFECFDQINLNLIKNFINEKSLYSFFRIRSQYPTSVFNKEDWTNNYYAIPLNKIKLIPSFIFERNFLTKIE